MKKIRTSILVLITSLNTTYCNSTGFTENKGQVTDQYYAQRPDVLFCGNTNGLTYHLRTNGISYQLYKNDNQATNTISDRSQKTFQISNPIETYRVDINWKNANSNFEMSYGQTIDGDLNFYTEGCLGGITGVRTFNEITYKNIYNNTDLLYYYKNGSLKYEFIVGIGARLSDIDLEITGATVIEIDPSGNLVIKTPFGHIVEDAPVVLQDGKVIPSSWSVKNNHVSFNVPHYDLSRPLIIDPITRLWGTYYGGNSEDDIVSMCTSGSSVYICGQTKSNNATFIATTGSHQSTIGGGYEAFLAKFNTTGVRQWATYYGGSGSETANACKVDASGNIYLAGSTNSTTTGVIASTGTHQETIGSTGGFHDAFLVKFNSAGIRVWGTYFGGSKDEFGNCCAIDASGNIYLTGSTNTTTSTTIATPGAHKTTFTGGPDPSDGFLAKFNSSGIRQWSTYYGSSGQEVSYSCETDASGNIFIFGQTYNSSGSGIASPGCYQSTEAGEEDCFIAKFNSTGTRLWGTFYGGTSREYTSSNGLAIDPSGNIFLTGHTLSYSGMSTPGSYQEMPGLYMGAPSGDCFLGKFNTSGNILWSTYFGGIGNEWLYSNGVSTDPFGDVFICGSTQTVTGMTTPDAYQTTLGGINGHYDAFLAKFSAAGSKQWCTYYGDQEPEFGYVCAADNAGGVYLAGTTNTDGSILASSSAHQNIATSSPDGFLVRFNSTLGLRETEEIVKSHVYPNPVTNELNIVFEKATKADILLTDVTGKIIHRSVSADTKSVLNTASLETGVYLLTIETGNERTVTKVIKQ